MFGFFFFSSRRRHTRWPRDWSSDVCSSDLAQRGHGDRLGLDERGHPGHAHQPWPAVDLGAARAALAGLAVPPDGEVAGLCGLQPVDDVEDDLALVDLDGVVAQLTALGVPAPDPEVRLVTQAGSP